MLEIRLALLCAFLLIVDLHAFLVGPYVNAPRTRKYLSSPPVGSRSKQRICRGQCLNMIENNEKEASRRWPLFRSNPVRRRQLEELEEPRRKDVSGGSSKKGTWRQTMATISIAFMLGTGFRPRAANAGIFFNQQPPSSSRTMEADGTTTTVKNATKRDSKGASAAGLGVFYFYVISRFVGSARAMANQRKRVRSENTRLKQMEQEYMNVEGEVAFDEDLMKELKKLKEDAHAGPLDKLAAKITHADQQETKPKSPGAVEEDDLLGAEARAADAATAKEAEERAKKERAARLSKLFDSSPDAGDDDSGEPQ